MQYIQLPKELIRGVVLCVWCGSDNSRITGTFNFSQTIKRYRLCGECKKAFVTYAEVVDKRSAKNGEKLYRVACSGCERNFYVAESAEAKPLPM